MYTGKKRAKLTHNRTLTMIQWLLVESRNNKVRDERGGRQEIIFFKILNLYWLLIVKTTEVYTKQAVHKQNTNA